MTDDSEKRFHSIMDKLFHSPKSAPNSSSSSSNTQTSRGKKRANPSSALALVEPKSSSNVVVASLAPSTSYQAPMCRPWDRGDLMRRLATFKSMTWFAKPKVMSALNCARRGWINVDIDTITCEACQARLLFSTPSAWNQQQVEKLAAVFSLKLDRGHKLHCPWIDNVCDEILAQFPPTPAPVLVDKFKERCSALLQLSFLPVISSSATEHMRTPELEKILEQSLVLHNENGSAEISRTEYLGHERDEDLEKKYYQAQKLISLCGWEPRLMPYVVDTGHASTQSLVKANVSSLLNVVANGQKNIGIDVQSTRVDEVPEANENYNSYDPNSVVLDCRLCGASVGLWTFSMVPRPMELFRLVGYAEINSEDHSGNHDLVTENNPENRREIISTGSNSATLAKERCLNLTIAGGPPPTKQNFKAIISLPVIGRALRARFCNDAAFCDHLGFNQEKGHTGGRGDASGKENDSRTSLEGIEFTEPGTLSESRIHSHEMEPQSNFQDNMLVENVGNDDLNPSTVTPDEGTNRIGENGKDDVSLMVSPHNGDLLHISHTDIVHGEDTSVAGYDEPSSVPSCSETNVDMEKTRNDDQTTLFERFNSQENGVGNRQIPVNDELVSGGTGKDQQVSSEKAMEFDPIRQHKHFCPWIAPMGKAAPGWQQTQSALLRHQGSSPSSSKVSPSASIIEVDDPITSVRKLFMSPSLKRMKRDLVSTRNTQN
ncbi:uncharacterized protein LOC21405100 [Morus notabilis]|uniref:uncharacterized protein LOC21405100 n=1 Tax=Morus notabilis TaxID=981085 RepID=UPI000CED32BF|nr:uncharacterized protein LOC21405100 [Morus notabilis]